MKIVTKKSIKMKIQNKNMQRLLVISSLLLTFVTVWGSMGLGTASAEQMETINASIVVPAPIDKVWSIVADVDEEPQYWSSIKEVKNVKTTSNVTERDVTLNINDAKAHQIITLHPKDSIVVNQTEGPITGTRTMTLSVPNNDNNETKIDVSWKMDLSRIPIIGKGFAKDGIFKTTEEALKKIASAAEKTP